MKLQTFLLLTVCLTVFCASCSTEKTVVYQGKMSNRISMNGETLPNYYDNVEVTLKRTSAKEAVLTIKPTDGKPNKIFEKCNDFQLELVKGGEEDEFKLKPLKCKVDSGEMAFSGKVLEGKTVPVSGNNANKSVNRIDFGIEGDYDGDLEYFWGLNVEKPIEGEKK